MHFDWSIDFFLSNFVSLWHISKLSFYAILTHFKIFFTYSHNETPFNQGKLKIFTAGIHLNWNIECFQILCHCDISVNGPFYAFVDTFCNFYWFTVTMKLLLITKIGKYSKLDCILTEILTPFKFCVIVTYQ